LPCRPRRPGPGDRACHPWSCVRRSRQRRPAHPFAQAAFRVARAEGDGDLVSPSAAASRGSVIRAFGARRRPGRRLEMSKIASELLVERLIDWGVDTVFGLPGDGINGIMEGLRRNEDRIRFVLVTHEEAAAFMASGYAKSTGRLGVC